MQRHECERAQMKGTWGASLAKRHTDNAKDGAAPRRWEEAAACATFVTAHSHRSHLGKASTLQEGSMGPESQAHRPAKTVTVIAGTAGWTPCNTPLPHATFVMLETSCFLLLSGHQNLTYLRKTLKTEKILIIFLVNWKKNLIIWF